jgi:quercetin dioxygenase-like cupin family protein
MRTGAATWLHPAPARQLMIGLRGTVEITAGHETRRFGPGDVLLMEDTTGAGHQTQVAKGGAVLFVQLA